MAVLEGAATTTLEGRSSHPIQGQVRTYGSKRIHVQLLIPAKTGEHTETFSQTDMILHRDEARMLARRITQCLNDTKE